MEEQNTAQSTNDAAGEEATKKLEQDKENELVSGMYNAYFIFIY